MTHVSVLQTCLTAVCEGPVTQTFGATEISRAGASAEPLPGKQVESLASPSGGAGSPPLPYFILELFLNITQPSCGFLPRRRELVIHPNLCRVCVLRRDGFKQQLQVNAGAITRTTRRPARAGSNILLTDGVLFILSACNTCRHRRSQEQSST